MAAYRDLAEKADRAMASQWFLLAFLGAVTATMLISVNIANIGISIITAAAVFMSAGSQRRQSQATQGKLDEIIACLPKARNDMLHIEDKEEHEIEAARV